MSKLPVEGCVLVIFGASGDLTRRKLLPAIYNLAQDDLLPETFAILGVARTAVDEADYRAQMRAHVESIEGKPLNPDTWRRIESRLHYIYGEFDDPSLFASVSSTLATIQAEHRIPKNVLFYFAIPPEAFGTVATQLDTAGLTQETEGFRRVVIEKPFGYDLATARELNQQLRQCLTESQIYRIDHYLGKETVQNILAFRFANGIFEPIWNRRYVDHVQMTVAETGGIGQRGAYYDRAGALRDIVQNHMLQLLALVAMEPPGSFAAEDLRDEKVKTLRAIVGITADEVRQHAVRGQYDGYQDEPHVASASRTETYAALRLQLDNWRWAGVPFYLRTGKRLKEQVTEIAIQFKRAPLMLFRSTEVRSLNPNVLVLRIQPNEGISLSFDAKVPGPLDRLDTVTMDFGYQDYFKTEAATGYETLLFDAIVGDQTLFHRMDIVEAGWQAMTPILDAWAHDVTTPVPTYAPDTWGPGEADVLIEQDGRAWRP